MRQYELLLVVPGTVTEEEAKPIIEGAYDVLRKLGATIVSSHSLGKCRLSYPIQHIRYGYYSVCYFEAEPSAISGMQKKFAIMNQILRAVISQFDERTQKKRTTPVVSDIALAAMREEARREGFSPERRAFDTVPTHFPARQEEKVATLATDAPRTTAAVELADIDKKLDEILDKDLTNV